MERKLDGEMVEFIDLANQLQPRTKTNSRSSFETLPAPGKQLSEFFNYSPGEALFSKSKNLVNSITKRPSLHYHLNHSLTKNLNSTRNYSQLHLKNTVSQDKRRTMVEGVSLPKLEVKRRSVVDLDLSESSYSPRVGVREKIEGRRGRRIVEDIVMKSFQSDDVREFIDEPILET